MVDAPDDIVARSILLPLSSRDLRELTSDFEDAFRLLDELLSLRMASQVKVDEAELRAGLKELRPISFEPP